MLAPELVKTDMQEYAVDVKRLSRINRELSFDVSGSNVWASDMGMNVVSQTP